MRRSEKKMADRSAVEGVLASCAVGRLGTVGPDGWPMVKPVNFAYDRGRLYFHTAREGEKIDHLRAEPRVCFEADQPVAYVRPRAQACEADYLFRSVIVRGRAILVEDPQEKRQALGLLMDKYEGPGRWPPLPEAKVSAVGVVRIDVEEMAGKEHLGKGSLRERAEAALERAEALPVVLERE